MRNQEQTTTSQGHSYLKPKAKYRVPEERKVELFASIKKSSEYYHQGLNQDNNPLIFRIDGILHGNLSFRLNSNNYSCHDLTFYVKDAKGQLIPLAGGMKK
jgi:hypothetical protein